MVQGICPGTGSTVLDRGEMKEGGPDLVSWSGSFVAQERRPIMTHPTQSNEFGEAIQPLLERGCDVVARALELLRDEVMKIEHPPVLRAGPCQRTEER